MRRAGQPLDPWQVDSITLMLSIRPDGKWACFEYCEWCSRQNGKGTILEARALAGLLLLGEKLIMWSAHEVKTAMEAFRRMQTLVRALGRRIADNLYDIDGIRLKIINTNGDEGIERLPDPNDPNDAGQRLKFIARSKSSGRGFSGDVNIIDETFAYTRAMQDALMPTMSARPNPQIIYTSSPPLSSDSGEVMFTLRLRGDPTADRGPDEEWKQDDSLGYRDWGLAGDLDHLDDIDIEDPELHAATNPSLGIRITPETVRRELRSMGREGFCRERLGIWPVWTGGGSGVISAQQWRDQIADANERPTDRVFAVMVNNARTMSAIMAVGPLPSNPEHLLVSIVDHRPGTHWLPARAAALKAKWNPVAIALQDKGPTGALMSKFAELGMTPPEDSDKPRRGDLAVPWADDVADAYGMFVDGIRQGTLWHLDEGPLNTAVMAAPTRALSGGTAWDYRGDVEVVSLLAGTIGVWAWTVRAPLVMDTYDPVSNFW